MSNIYFPLCFLYWQLIIMVLRRLKFECFEINVLQRESIV
ncbi:MAG: hypothetical protein ACI86M_001835, partial [Saprospiraceae bacterium]